jgi:hypothetical protein
MAVITQIDRGYVSVDDNRSFDRLNEIWCSTGGNVVCVRSNCAGSRMSGEIGNNPRQAKTIDGAWRYTPAERIEWRELCFMEFGEVNPTCECGSVRV